MLHRLCGPPSIPLSFNLAAVLPRRGTYRVISGTESLASLPTPSTHRLRPGLPGYLIPFAPLAFAPQRQCLSRKPPSPPMFLPISTHFTATPGIPLPSPALQPGGFPGTSSVEPRTFTRDFPGPPTRPLRPVIPNNARPPRVTAAAGTELAGASSRGTVTSSSLETGVYDPKAFFLHAALLRQGFPHCAKFPTAASRRSLGRVAVPVWPSVLSDRLPIVALVSLYLTN